MSVMDSRRQAVMDQYARVLGRQPRQDELDYIVGLMENDAISGAEVGQALEGMPEYQNRLLDQNANRYSQFLGANDDAILGKAAAQAQSNFSGLGRPVSSGMGAQFASAAQNLAMQRQSALAQFYGQGLNQTQALTQGFGQNALNRGYGLRDEKRQRGYQIEDYYRQKNDYESARKGMSGWNAITPEFVASGLFSMGGKAAAAYTGGMAGNPKAGQDVLNRGTPETQMYGSYPSNMGPSWNYGGR